MFSRLPDLMIEDRLCEGYVIVLPGIEGYSLWNRSIVRGLLAADVPYAIEIHDWTYGRFLSVYSLVASQRHRDQSRVIADKIVRYRSEHPYQPVYVIGHSGGGAMMLLSLAQLPEGVTATGGVAIAPAISREFDVRSALRRTTRGLWNVSSWGDMFFMGGSLLLGNVDRCWRIPAGLAGFSPRLHEQIRQEGLPPLREMTYCTQYLASRNLGGHFGGVAVPFVKNHVAPWLLQDDATLSVPADRFQPAPR